MHDDLPTASLGSDDRSTASSAGLESLGSAVGRYTLVRVLGEGGFGVVFEAEQREPVRRRVALKVIKPGMDSGAVIARFEAERQALAVMDHPCIARVYDGGTTPPEQGGRPYFVMELVRGVPITEHCDTQRLTVEQRAELFIRVCEAVQHAHAKGVIHRDLKPSNVLVSYDEHGGASVKVIDFGIAKALSQRLAEATVFTEHGQLIGTPEYMSPEQAEASGQDVDTRSDVYSLGVMLYELMAGRLPFDSKSLRSAGFAEIQRIIRDVEPARPSTRLSMGDTAELAGRRRTEARQLTRTLRRDLDWVVMRCLEKDRSRRYETAEALADELRRFLDGEPVRAGPPTAGYRLTKFAGKHRRGLIVAGVVAVLLVLATLVSTTLALGLAREQARTARALDERDDALALERERAAELGAVAKFQSRQLASIDASLMGERLRSELLGSIPVAAREAFSDQLSGVDFTGVATRMLEQGVFDRSLEAIRSSFSEQPLVQAKLLQALADTMTEVGLLDGALVPQREALAIRRRELGEADAETLASLSWLGVLQRMRGEEEEAERLTRAALEGRRALLGEGHVDTLESMNNLGFLLQSRGELDEGERLIRLSLEGREKLLGEDDRSTLISLNNMGVVLTQQGRLEEAERYFRRSVEGNRRVLGGDDPITLHSVNNLGLVMAQRGRFGEAGELWEEALAGYRLAYGDGHPSTLIAMHNLAKLRLVMGEHERAEALALECESGNRDRWGASHRERLDAVGLLVEVYEAWAQAEPDAGHAAQAERWRGELAASEGEG